MDLWKLYQLLIVTLSQNLVFLRMGLNCLVSITHSYSITDDDTEYEDEYMQRVRYQLLIVTLSLVGEKPKF